MPLLIPPDVATVTVRFPSGAFGAIVSVTVSDAALGTFTVLAVTPVPLTATRVDPGTVPKLVPVSVTCAVEPLVALAGEMDVSVGISGGGGAGAVIVKSRGLLVPLAVVSVTWRAPSEA